MMSRPGIYSQTSLQRLATCDPRLQAIMKDVIKVQDITIICGHRPNEEQAKLFANGDSKVPAGQSKHNRRPSHAVDIAPVPLRWRDTLGFVRLAGIVAAVAERHGVRLRWGGNWDGDHHLLTDQTFDDLVHYEIVED